MKKVTQSSSKIARILAHLVRGETLNRFEAEHLGDHCLNSTISTLANRFGLIVSRQQESIPSRWGKPCKVTRYKLAADQMETASQVLVYLEAQGGSQPL